MHSKKKLKINLTFFYTKRNFLCAADANVVVDEIAEYDDLHIENGYNDFAEHYNMNCNHVDYNNCFP